MLNTKVDKGDHRYECRAEVPVQLSVEGSFTVRKNGTYEFGSPKDYVPSKEYPQIGLGEFVAYGDPAPLAKAVFDKVVRMYYPGFKETTVFARDENCAGVSDTFIGPPPDMRARLSGGGFVVLQHDFQVVSPRTIICGGHPFVKVEPEGTRYIGGEELHRASSGSFRPSCTRLCWSRSFARSKPILSPGCSFAE
jgi:hypothetical protein